MVEFWAVVNGLLLATKIKDRERVHLVVVTDFTAFFSKKMTLSMEDFKWLRRSKFGKMLLKAWGEIMETILKRDDFYSLTLAHRKAFENLGYRMTLDPMQEEHTKKRNTCLGSSARRP